MRRNIFHSICKIFSKSVCVREYNKSNVLACVMVGEGLSNVVGVRILTFIKYSFYEKICILLKENLT